MRIIIFKDCKYCKLIFILFILFFLFCFIITSRLYSTDIQHILHIFLCFAFIFSGHERTFDIKKIGNMLFVSIPFVIALLGFLPTFLKTDIETFSRKPILDGLKPAVEASFNFNESNFLLYFLSFIMLLYVYFRMKRILVIPDDIDYEVYVE